MNVYGGLPLIVKSSTSYKSALLVPYQESRLNQRCPNEECGQWQKLSIDIFGEVKTAPSHQKFVITCIDLYSHYPEVALCEVVTSNKDFLTAFFHVMAGSGRLSQKMVCILFQLSLKMFCWHMEISTQELHFNAHKNKV